MKYFTLILASLCLGCGAISGPPSVVHIPDRFIEVGRPVIDFPDPPDPHAYSPYRPGETVQLTAQVKTAWGYMRPLDNSEVTWRSLDTTVATIDADGLVTLLLPGQAQFAVDCETCPPTYRDVGEHDVRTWLLGFTVEQPHSPTSSHAR